MSESSEPLHARTPRSNDRARNLDDRIRLFAFLCADVIFVLAVSCTIWLDAIKHQGADGTLESYNFKQLAAFFIVQFVAIVVSAAMLGADIWRRFLGLGGRLLAFFNPDNQELRAWSDRWMNTPLEKASLRHAVALRAVLALWAISMVLLASATGGLQNSPFLQFGFTVVVLGMLLTDRVWGRVLLAGLAVALLIAVAVASSASGESDFYIALWPYFLLSLVNLFFQLVIVAAGANQLGGLNVLKDGSTDDPAPPDP